MPENQQETTVQAPAEPVVEKKAVVRRVRRTTRTVKAVAKAAPQEKTDVQPELPQAPSKEESVPAPVKEDIPPEAPQAEIQESNEQREAETPHEETSQESVSDQGESSSAGEGEENPQGQQPNFERRDRRDFDRGRRGFDRHGRHANMRYQKGGPQQGRGCRRMDYYPQDINILEHPEAPVLNVNAYACLPQDRIRSLGVEKCGLSEDQVLDMRNQEILAAILKAHTAAGGVIVGSGTLEILPDGYGFLRSANNSYLSGPEDIYISGAQIKSLQLKTGDVVYGQVRTPRDGERYFAILRILQVNNEDPIKAKTRVPFESLTPIFPNERINLETPEEDV